MALPGSNVFQIRADFGVAKADKNGRIEHLVEKPKELSNNLALVGFYYFREGKELMKAIETQMEQKISLNNEYFLADAINVMLASGANFRIQEVEVWLDAGKVDALLETNQYLLSHGHDNSQSCRQTRRSQHYSTGLYSSAGDNKRIVWLARMFPSPRTACSSMP